MAGKSALSRSRAFRGLKYFVTALLSSDKSVQRRPPFKQTLARRADCFSSCLGGFVNSQQHARARRNFQRAFVRSEHNEAQGFPASSTSDGNVSCSNP